ncbi:MAG: hypothetical protein AAF419_00345 [Pseudomonadota bacterium]
MKTFRIITGLLLILIITPINGIAGYGYTFGGIFGSSLNVMFSDSEQDPRLSVTIDQDGKKHVKPKDTSSALKLIASTKHGAFGLFLLIFIWFQTIAGVILIANDKAEFKLALFLGFVACGSLLVEIIGASLSSSFGTTNILGSSVAVLLALHAITMYKTTVDKK